MRYKAVLVIVNIYFAYVAKCQLLPRGMYLPMFFLYSLGHIAQSLGRKLITKTLQFVIDASSAGHSFYTAIAAHYDVTHTILMRNPNLRSSTSNEELAIAEIG